MNQISAILIAYDNGSHIPFLPLHLAYLAQAMLNHGWKVEIFHQDIEHYSDAVLTEKIEAGRYDFVGLGFVGGYYQYRKALSISQAVNRCRNRSEFLYVLGGHGPAAAPEYFLRKCEADHVVVGEGEKAVFNLDAPVVKKPCKVDFSPAFFMFPLEVYRLHRFPNSRETDFTMPILSGRGCPYHCTFCYRMVPGFRPRKAADVMEEIFQLHFASGINHFQFADELLMSSKDRAVEFSEAIMRLPFKIKWDCNGRLNYADQEVLTVMKRSGCNYINYGVEALDDEVLHLMKKKLTVETITRGVEATVGAGITPGLNLMWGNRADTRETLQKAVEFLLKYDGVSELRTIRPVTPYPGSELFDYAVEQGLLEGVEDFYERKHTNSDLFTVSFMEGITPKEADLHLMRANDRLVSAYYMRCAAGASAKASRFYGGQDKEFRGWRPV